MLREILFGHGLIVRDILPIGKILLSLLQLPLCLCKFRLLHFSGRPLGDLVELVLVGGFIIDIIGAEIEMCLP